MSADDGFPRLPVQGIEVMRRQYDDDAQTGRSMLGIVIGELCPRRCERADRSLDLQSLWYKIFPVCKEALAMVLQAMAKSWKSHPKKSASG